MIKLGNNKVYIILNQVALSVLSLLLGKFIALNLEPELYGEYVLELAIYTFIYSFFMSPYIQFYKATLGNFMNKVGADLYRKTLIGSVLFSILTLFFCFTLYYKEFSFIKLVLISLFLFLTVLYRIELDRLNIKSRFKEFVKLSITQSVLILTTFLLIDKLSLFKDTTLILWVSNFMGVVFIIKIKSKRTINKLGLRFYNDVFYKKYFLYIRPLMILAIWSWLSNYFDRYAIGYFLNTKDVGVYNANYSIGSKFFLLISPFFITILTPVIYGKDAVSVKMIILLKYFKYYCGIAIVICLFVYVFRDFIGSLLLSVEYAEGFYLIFWICIAFFFYSLTLVLDMFFYHSQNTKVILNSHLFASIINIFGNLVLIPLIGVFGAAISTLLSFFLRFVYMNISHKNINL